MENWWELSLHQTTMTIQVFLRCMDTILFSSTSVQWTCSPTSPTLCLSLLFFWNINIMSALSNVTYKFFRHALRCMNFIYFMLFQLFGVLKDIECNKNAPFRKFQMFKNLDKEGRLTWIVETFIFVSSNVQWTYPIAYYLLIHFLVALFQLCIFPLLPKFGYRHLHILTSIQITKFIW